MSLTNERRDELIIEMHGMMKAHTDTIARHDKSLYGNGKPGLCDDMTSLKQIQKSKAAMVAVTLSALGVAIAAGAVIVSIMN